MDRFKEILGEEFYNEETKQFKVDRGLSEEDPMDASTRVEFIKHMSQFIVGIIPIEH